MLCSSRTFFFHECKLRMQNGHPVTKPGEVRVSKLSINPCGVGFSTGFELKATM